jgi:hypothetical protein
VITYKNKNIPISSGIDDNQPKHQNPFGNPESYKRDLDKRIKGHYGNKRIEELNKLGHPFFNRQEGEQKNCVKYHNIMEDILNIGIDKKKDKNDELILKWHVKIIVQNIKIDPNEESRLYVIQKEIRHTIIDRPEFTSIMYNPLFFDDQYLHECVRIGLKFPVDNNFNNEYTFNDPALSQHHIEQLRKTITHLLYDIGIRYNSLEDIWIKDETL